MVGGDGRDGVELNWDFMEEVVSTFFRVFLFGNPTWEESIFFLESLRRRVLLFWNPLKRRGKDALNRVGNYGKRLFQPF